MAAATDSGSQETSITEPGIHVELTHDPLDVNSILSRVKSPSAGAVVLFAGTTRDSFAARPVLHLEYSAYIPLALRTILTISRSVKETHGLMGICVVHRLGTVPIGEESVLVAVSAAHRGEAWRAGEQALEEVKARAEIWKLERFGDEDGEGVWRANRDGA